MLPLDCGLAFDTARDAEFFVALPPRPAVFLIEPREAAAEPYLLRTADLRRRAERLLLPAEAPSKRLNLRSFAAGVRYRLTGSAFEQSLAFYQHARQMFPRRYRDLARLRRPVLMKVNLANEYPRCYVIRRILADNAFYFGPFHSRRGAEAFAGEFLNFFKVRRCQIKIRRDPEFPGCIYSEMKMCLAPCFAGCSKEEYNAEVTRLVTTLATSGAALEEELEREREAASEALDYERASAVHKRLEKLAGVLRVLPGLPRQVDELNAVVLQPAAEDGAVAVFGVRGGFIADPLVLRFGELASQPRSVEEILRENLSAQSRAPETTGDARQMNEQRGEHLSLLARWFYSKPRTGEIFFPQATRHGLDWPYRRIIRACSRILAPPLVLEPDAPRPEPPKV